MNDDAYLPAVMLACLGAGLLAAVISAMTPDDSRFAHLLQSIVRAIADTLRAIGKHALSIIRH